MQNTQTLQHSSESHAPHLASRISRLEASPVREILSIASKPGMISFAGGLPSPETFPAFDLSAIPAHYLQYGPSEGDEALRCAVAEHLGTIGLNCQPSQVVILSGSQQGIDLVAKLFIEPGTRVALESPTYLAALQPFRLFGAEFVTMQRASPAATLSHADRPAFVYAIPTFQNPTGHCYTAEERGLLASACDTAGVPLFEDDPYRDLVYDTCERTPVCARLKQASWVYQGSFSKNLAPGLRLGFLVASPDLVQPLLRLKQAADLHSNRLSQWLVLESLRAPGYLSRLRDIAAFYRVRRDFFGEVLERYFSGIAQWELPPGGLFFWLTLDRKIDTRTLLPQALREGVAFTPGEPFFPHAQKAGGALRLNFSHATEAQVEKGLMVLSSILRAALAGETSGPG